jgi:hypothetical protein
MKTYSEESGYAAIETAKRMAPTASTTAIVRLFAVAMVFYRGPVGDRACDELNAIMGKGRADALFYLCGFSRGTNDLDRWAELAGIES